MENTDPHVIRQINRASPELISGLKAAGSAMVCEAMNRENLLPAHLRPIWPGAAIAGSAVTIHAAFGDNYMVHVAIELLQPGDVLVLVPSQPDVHAYFGEMMAVSAKAFGCAGLIIDAGIRDIAALREMGFPAWASAICPAGTDRRQLGTVNLPIEIAGVPIAPGDIIVADDDGVCRVPLQDADKVLVAAQQKMAAEDDIRRRLAAGEPGLDVYGLRSKLAALGMRYDTEA